MQIAGYTAAQITGFGDLVKLPEEKMQALLNNKIELEIANLLGEAITKRAPRMRKLHGRKRKRSR